MANAENTGAGNAATSDWHALEAACRAQVAQLEAAIALRDIPDVRALCEAIGAVRGRAIQLEPHPLSRHHTGMWLGGETADTIYYLEDAPALHQQHIILHELGHMLRHHRSPLEEAEALHTDLLTLLGPDLILRALARSGYDLAEEREAEFFASLIEQRWAAARAQSAEVSLFWGRSP